MKNQDNKLFKRIEKDLKQLRFSQVEAGFNHLSYSEELNLYQYVKNGDMKAVKHSAEMFAGDRVGKLSDDPIRNGQYMFVASITTACRFCIEGGMDPQESYGLSDIYIHAVDKCRTIDEIKDLHKDMITDYTRRMSRLKHSITYSPQMGDACNSATFMFFECSSTIEEYRESLISMKAWSNRHDTVLFSHPHNIGGKEVLEQAIALCDEIISGKDDRVPVNGYEEHNVHAGRKMLPDFTNMHMLHTSS